jgi:hypothetical protein
LRSQFDRRLWVSVSLRPASDQIRSMVNLKTGKALNLEIPPTLIATADEVME